MTWPSWPSVWICRSPRSGVRAAGVKNVQTLSDHRDASFGNAYGVLIEDLRLLARAVFVVDKDGRIRYIQIVKELSSEPDYEAALKALREAQR